MTFSEQISTILFGLLLFCSCRVSEIYLHYIRTWLPHLINSAVSQVEASSLTGFVFKHGLRCRFRITVHSNPYNVVIETLDLNLPHAVVIKQKFCMLFKRGLRLNFIVFGTETQALTHCYKFLWWSGVNGNCLVKVRFGSTHFDGHRKALKHLITAQTLHVQTYHLQKRKQEISEK